MLFDLRREIDVSAMLLEPGRVRDTESLLIGAGGNMNDIHQIFHRPGDTHALVQVIAALHELIAAHADLDGEPRPDGFSHRREDFSGKAHPVLKTATVLVRAVVEQRGEELVDEPAVAGVDHEHLEARAFRQGGGVSVGGDDLVDELLRELFYRGAVRPCAGRRPPLGHLLLFVAVGEIRPGELAGVGQLEGGDGAVALDGVGGVGEAGKALGHAQIQPEGVAAVRGVDHALGDGDRRGAAVGAQLIELQGPGTDAAVCGDIRAAHGRGEHPVTKDRLADGDG